MAQPKISVGDFVEAHSLQGAKDLNGRVGRVRGREGERIMVDFGIPVGEKSIRPQNLTVVMDPSLEPPPYPGGESSQAAVEVGRKAAAAAHQARVRDYVRKNRLDPNTAQELMGVPLETARMVAEEGELGSDIISKGGYVRSRIRKAGVVAEEIDRLDMKGQRDLDLSRQVCEIMSHNPAFKCQYHAISDRAFGEDLGKWDPMEHPAALLRVALKFCMSGKYVGLVDSPAKTEWRDGDWQCDVKEGGCGTVNSAARQLAGTCYRCGKDQPKNLQKINEDMPGRGNWGLGLPPGRESGVVASWNEEKGFGFVRPDRGGVDIFFLATAGQVWPYEEGQRVTFRRGENPEKAGKVWALEVRPVGAAPTLEEEEKAKLEKARRKCKLYIGQIGPQTDENDLRRLFEQYGDISEVALLRNLDDSHRGSGFIVFEDLDDATRAVEALNKTMWNGRMLVVRIADKSSQLRVCCEAIQGKCIYGNRCRNSHDDDGVTACSHVGTCRAHAMRNARAAVFNAATGSTETAASLNSLTTGTPVTGWGAPPPPPPPPAAGGGGGGGGGGVSNWPGSEPVEKEEPPKQVCCHFLLGTCTYGMECPKGHIDDGVAPCSFAGCITHAVRSCGRAPASAPPDGAPPGEVRVVRHAVDEGWGFKFESDLVLVAVEPYSPAARANLVHKLGWRLDKVDGKDVYRLQDCPFDRNVFELVLQLSERAEYADESSRSRRRVRSYSSSSSSRSRSRGRRRGGRRDRSRDRSYDDRKDRGRRRSRDRRSRDRDRDRDFDRRRR
eukprot:TRINITY_DN3227_c0_g1_i1.p1 TRINITY_DN3227_c0_g1~~TRINITY_DN3227_c0_g1_i1.p1  ORF type:complete len:780 (+),score=224.49 TRINITY_DN3227_c0_g1_i1:81-2420(+)